jgi:hypothetical protein
MKNVLILGSLIVFIAFISCKKDETTPNENNNIRFDDMKVGQKSRYVKWEGFPWHGEADTTYKQVSDTVTLTIVAQDSAGFKISETHNAGTSSIYYFKIEGDSLKVKPFEPNGEFSSFVFYQPKTSYVLKDNNLDKIELSRWAVPKNTSVVKKFFKAENFKINNTAYTSAISYYDTNPIIVDGPAFYSIYTKEKGFISFQRFGGFAPIGVQYNLLK